MSQLRCDECTVKFESRDMLAMHMLDHSFTNNKGKDNESRDQQIQCVSSINKNNLKEAVMRLNLCSMNAVDKRDNSKYPRCEICLLVFSDRDTLAMHTLSHANERDFVRPARAESHACSHCGMVFSYEDMLILHVMSQHKQSSRHPLDLSMKSSKLKRCHSDDAITDNSVSPQKKILMTNLCGQLLDNRASTRYYKPTHETKEMSEKVLTEQYLSQKEDKTKDNSVRHLERDFKYENIQLSKKSSQSTDISTSKSSQSGCSFERFYNPIDGLQKALMNNRDAFYFCPHCNIIFLDRAMFHLHAGLHNHNSPWQCNICGKKCSSSLEFSAHVIHT